MKVSLLKKGLFSSLFLAFIALPSSNAIANPSVSIAKDPWSLEILKPVFPSLLLSTSMLKMNTPGLIGDPHSIIRVKIHPNVPNATIKITASVDGLSRTSEYDGTLGQAGQDYLIAPTIRWRNSRLLKLAQPEPDTITVSVTMNGVSLGSKTQTVEVHSINDAVTGIKQDNGQIKDTSLFFASYVNENSPLVEYILQEALHYRAVSYFAGYNEGQATPQQVEMQVFAIWNVLQRHHMRYSNIAPSSISSSGKVYSQTVRFIEQSWNSQQANCVDGSVLFASVLYKIGLDPVLVHIPGHMFVGYYLNPAYDGTLRDIQFLETTMVGQGELPGPNSMRFGHFLNPAVYSDSYKEFARATAEGDVEYNSELVPNLIRHVPFYGVIDIKQARMAGINPISE